jgi:hypothetical protein
MKSRASITSLAYSNSRLRSRRSSGPLRLRSTDMTTFIRCAHLHTFQPMINELEQHHAD